MKHYLRERKLRKRVEKFWELMLVILVVLFALWSWSVVAGEIHLYAQTIVASCPDSGCNFYDKSHYADFPQDSFEFINGYCNAVLGTAKECD